MSTTTISAQFAPVTWQEQPTTTLPATALQVGVRPEVAVALERSLVEYAGIWRDLAKH